MLLNIISATFIVGLVSFTGIIIFLKKDIKQETIKMIISLAAGAMLGAVFFSLLPELFTHHENNNLKTKTLSIIILISISIFFIIEKIFHWHHCKCDIPEHQHQKKSMGYINLIGDGIHNFVDGTLIASSFLINVSLGISTTLAIILHEIPQEISDMGILIYSGFTKKRALFWNFISALTAIVGGILMFYLESYIKNLIPILIAIAIGSFLYLSMADIMPELHHEQNKKQLIKQFLMLITGSILMFIIGILHHH